MEDEKIMKRILTLKLRHILQNYSSLYLEKKKKKETLLTYFMLLIFN